MKIRCELHLHSFCSPDSILTPALIERGCAKKGIDYCAITDHNRLTVYELSSVKLIESEEILTAGGEIIGYFLKEQIERGLSIEETVSAIRSQGGLVSVPHPCDHLRPSAVKERRLEKALELVDMVEIFNARNLLRNHRIEQMLRDHRDIILIVGSDAHTPWEIGNCLVEMEDFHSPSEFLAKLKQARLLVRRPFVLESLLGRFNRPLRWLCGF